MLGDMKQNCCLFNLKFSQLFRAEPHRQSYKLENKQKQVSSFRTLNEKIRKTNFDLMRKLTTLRIKTKNC